MNYSVTLDAETESILARRAARLGITVAEYVARVATQSARPRPHSRSSSPEGRKTGAEVIAELRADGILTGYGDPGKSSSELARELREQFSSREQTP
jgi:predicted alpha/beta-hydrolase family hydrolase